jgi:hypothetical protein
MKNIFICLISILITGCNIPNANDKKMTQISFDFVHFDDKNFVELLSDSITHSFADSLLNQVKKENCTKIIKVTNSSDSSIWLFYFNRNIPKLSPEKISNFSIDSNNHVQIQGDQIVELFGTEVIEIKPKSNKSFLTCPYLPSGYSCYEMDFPYIKQKNSNVFEKYVLKCRFQGDSLLKID